MLKIIILNKQRKYKLEINSFKKIIKKFFDRKIFSEIKNKNFLKKINILIYINFVSLEKIKSLKNQLFNLNITTDVISIPIDSDFYKNEKNIFEKEIIFGEIFICPEKAFKQCKKFNNLFSDEIKLLLTHGLLHLIGFDDIYENDRNIMRQEEQNFLSFIKQ